VSLRLAMLGMILGNGHPWSWSAIINGYDPAAMAACPYAGIQNYLGSQGAEGMGIPGAQVTHIWTDNPAEAPAVALAAKIPHVVASPEDVIGEVDAVIIATDDGEDHVRRARPFVEAGLPVFVDKPLAVTVEELRTFVGWRRDGARILSSSGMRYAPEIEIFRDGYWHWLTGVTCKTWERYGIHILEPLSAVLGRGFVDVRHAGQSGRDAFTLTHSSGTVVTLGVMESAIASFGTFHAYGQDRQISVQATDTYAAFRGQLLAVVQWLQTGREPVDFAETTELMAALIAGRRSREQGTVSVAAVLDELNL
jgi:predicted dehydrogenase